jgi:NADPH:quinone reductase-like Zn-dependent oxidoreductase
LLTIPGHRRIGKSDGAAIMMKALRLHAHGEPADVLRLEDAPVPAPGPNQIRVRVQACGLNPADWALCAGLFFPGALPRGIGLDVSGHVDALGEGVTDVRIGERVFGVPDFLAGHSAGAADHAVLMAWEPVPEGLDLLEAATLPMAVETAVRSLDLLGLAPGQSILINGGGSMMGFAAVQVALLRGARVIATAGDTFAARLRAFGAKVTPYGEGMVGRVREIAGGPVDLALHAAMAPGVLADLIDIVGGDPRRVLSISDFDEGGLGVRTTGREPGLIPRYDALRLYAQLAATGRFVVPIARVFEIADWREAIALAFSNRARGKVMLLPGGGSAS